MSPAKVISIEMEDNGDEKSATVKVPSDQLSLAIGQKGQNVRLAAKLTGYKIDVLGEEDSSETDKTSVSLEEKENQKELGDNVAEEEGVTAREEDGFEGDQKSEDNELEK